MYNLRIIVRNIWRRRFTNSINLVGIVLGLTVSILLFNYVLNQYSANEFLPNHKQLHRIESNWGTGISYKHSSLFQEQVPEIEALTIYHISWSWKDLIHYQQKNHEIDLAVYADSSFFKVFEFPVLHGNLHTALNTKRSMVLTQSESERIFGTSNSVGKSIPFNTSEYGEIDYTITAVIKDIPANSSMNFNVVLNVASLMEMDGYANNANNWGTNNYTSFVKISQGANIDSVVEKMNTAIRDNTPNWVHNQLPVCLSPLAELHFDERGGDGVFIPAKKSTTHILGGIGFLILLMAGINYFNLNTAQLEENFKEIGIRKTVGASRYNIGLQSILTTVVLFAIALFISICLVNLILPFFNEFTNSSIIFGSLFNGNRMVLLLSIIGVSAILFGVFPALFAMNQKPISILVKNSNSPSRRWLKNGLMVFQFFAAIVLIASTIVLSKQNSFLLKKDYGYNVENILYMPLSPEGKGKKAILEQLYEEEVLVDEVAFSSALFGHVNSKWGRTFYGDGTEKQVDFRTLWVSYDFFDFFGLEINQGNGFTEYSSEHSDIIYNESFIRKYSINNPIGTSVDNTGERFNTIGVVKDFNHGSLREQISPLAFICSEQNTDILLIKTHQASSLQLKELISKMETHWNNVSPNFPFEAHFLDRHNEQIYDRELKMAKVLGIASGFSIVIASLGLFCIAYFTINKRIKEIGIRKVNGATKSDVLQLLNIDIIKWVIIAIILAIPTAHWALIKWLQNFAYKTELSWWVFALAGISAILIAAITVSWQTWRVAKRNPVEALRYE